MKMKTSSKQRNFAHNRYRQFRVESEVGKGNNQQHLWFLGKPVTKRNTSFAATKAFLRCVPLCGN